MAAPIGSMPLKRDARQAHADGGGTSPHAAAHGCGGRRAAHHGHGFGALPRINATPPAVLKQNIALALGIKLVFLALASAGQATLWMAVFADMGASLLVVFNGMRLLRPPKS